MIRKKKGVILTAAPNPFSNSTNIIFNDVQSQGSLVLQIYDISGRLVDKINQPIQSQCNEKVSWCAYNLPTGVYFVKLEASDCSHVIKVVKLNWKRRKDEKKYFIVSGVIFNNHCILSLCTSFGLAPWRSTGLIPEHDYVFGFALFEPLFDSGRVQSIAFGSQNITTDIAVPESVIYKCFIVPKLLYSGGALDIGLSATIKGAVLSQMAIWEHAAGGPQDIQRVDVENGLHVRVYPNPILNIVGVEYNLPQCTDVKLSIFDVNGRLVKETDYPKQEPGTHNESFDITHLSQGVYFVRLKTLNHSAMQKVIFVK
jgi:hypothetical protein